MQRNDAQYIRLGWRRRFGRSSGYTFRMASSGYTFRNIRLGWRRRFGRSSGLSHMCTNSRRYACAQGLVCLGFSLGSILEVQGLGVYSLGVEPHVHDLPQVRLCLGFSLGSSVEVQGLGIYSLGVVDFGVESGTQYYRMCSLTTECVLLLQNVFSYYKRVWRSVLQKYYRMCSLTTECVLLLQNVFSYYKRVWRAVLLGFKVQGLRDLGIQLQNVFSYYRMCSLTIREVQGLRDLGIQRLGVWGFIGSLGFQYLRVQFGVQGGVWG